MIDLADKDTGAVDGVPFQFEIRDVPSSASMDWFNKGLEDFKKAPLVSLSYGSIYVIIGLIMMALTWNNPLYMTTMVTGFLLIGPIVAVGFYCMSRAIEQGKKPSFSQGLDALKFNGISLMSFSLVLALIVIAWSIIASIMIALFSYNMAIGDSVWTALINHDQSYLFTLLYFLVGLFFASLVFVISVISVPLITDHRTDVMTAMIMSVKAVKKNPKATLSWAFMIAAMIFVGMLFFYVGLALTLPIIGHASWHAYRDLVVSKPA